MTSLPVIRMHPELDPVTGRQGDGAPGGAGGVSRPGRAGEATGSPDDTVSARSDMPAGLRSPGRYPGAPGDGSFGLPPEISRLWSALREVRDPELPVSLVDLGLIYDVRSVGDRVEVDMTFTATGCPCMGFMKMDVEDRLLREPGVASVAIFEVWSPPWRRDRMTGAARAVLKRCGVAA